MPNLITQRIQSQQAAQKKKLANVNNRIANLAVSQLPKQTGYPDGAPRMSMQGFGVIVGTAAKIALHMNVNRGYLYIQNNSSDDLYMSFDAKPNPKSALVGHTRGS